MRQGLLLICFFCVAFQSSAQEKEITFKVFNQDNLPVSFATVTVVPSFDTVQKMQQVCDSTGRTVFTLFADSLYTIRVSAVDFQPFEKNIALKGDQTVFDLMLLPVSGTLDQVIVRATKPLIRQEDDKTIIDPENLATISTNAFETIEKAPGLFIDPDGNIYISSTRPATVYINGREQKMSAEDIAALLKSLPPNAIAAIEIMRTPSAKYDASSSGGVVNVILRKGVKIGLTGSVTVGMQQGVYGNRFGSVNINNHDGPLTTYLNLYYGRRNTYDRIQTDRLFAIDSVLSQDAKTKYSSDNYYIGYGVSYELNKKWEISYDGRLSYNNNDNNSRNVSKIMEVSTGSSAGEVDTRVRNDGYHVYVSQGFNFRYKIDSLGSEWNTDLASSFSKNQTDQLFTIGEGDLSNRPNFFSAQTNLTKKFKGQITAEAGIKTTLMRFRSSTDYFKYVNGNKERDDERTRAYTYNEAIHAGYLQASKTISQVVIKVGTRVENTNMKGEQRLPTDTSFSVHRTDFFPYVYISRKVMTIADFELRAYLVYRRTISRPGYQSLNPAIRFIDPFLFETGNPALKPQFTNNYEANISVDERPLLAIGINDTRDIFTQVVYPTDSSSKVSYRTYDNVGTNKETYIRGMGAIPPGGKYFFVLGAQYNHNFYQGFYENKPLSFKKGSWTVFTYHTLKVTPLTVFSLSGFARFGGQQQFYELGDFGELRLSVNQQFLKKKLSLTVSVNDVFRTNKNSFFIRQGSIDATGLRESDTRRLGLNLRYSFGIRKKEESNNEGFNMEGIDK